MLENKHLMARDIISLLQDARLLLCNFLSVGLGAPTRGARLGSCHPPPVPASCPHAELCWCLQWVLGLCCPMGHSCQAQRGHRWPQVLLGWAFFGRGTRKSAAQANYNVT